MKFGALVETALFMTGKNVCVRRAVVGDEAILRELRLQAMLDSPEAFGSNYERELQRTEADWRRWLFPGATFILEVGGLSRGIVACAHDEVDELVVNLMAMWLAPSHRGTGASEQLVSAVVAWAKSESARCVRLHVIKSNDPARRLYERCGFLQTGHETRCENDDRIELRMELPV
jgi:GNAT superfamily N-acetyltransferase